MASPCPMWQKAQLRAAREKEEAEAQAKYEAKVKLEAEKKEKADAAIAKQKALAEAKRAAIESEKAAREASTASKTGGAVASKKADKFPAVEKVSPRAERIAARQAAGEDAPSLFGL